jgi:CPA2 family monovalent cation:H+ antiporter-2
VNESTQLQDVLILLLAAVAVVPGFRRLRASAVLGYLAAGALIGPHGFGLLHDVEAAAGLGELGVVFLLFSIGLSLSVERLAALRRYALGLGIAQVVVTAVALWGLLRAVGVESAAALVLGGGLALSSTAVVLRMLVERRELATPPGRIALAVLLLQDIAVVPLLTLVPLLRGGETSVLPALLTAMLRAALVLVVILVIGRVALRPLLRAVARDGPGSPMRTRMASITSESPGCGSSCRSSTPASVSTCKSVLRAMPCSYTYLARHRMPLPHIWASLPSALNMRMRQSA